MSVVTDTRSLLLKYAYEGRLGSVQALPTQRLLGRASYKIRRELLLLASESATEEEFASKVESTKHFALQVARLGEDVARRKAMAYRGLLQSFQEHGQWQDRDKLPIVLWKDGKLVKRIDGTHRLSVMEFLGYREAKCLVIHPDDYVKHFIDEGLPQFAKWYQSIEVAPGVWTHPRREHKEGAVVEMMPDVKCKRVLDLGCNDGLYSLTAARLGACRVVGIDKRGESVEQAEFVKHIWSLTKPSNGAVTFVAGDIFDKIDLVEHADVLLACCVVYHLGDRLHTFWKAVAESNICTVLIQGNKNRVKKLDPAKLADPVTADTPAPYIYDLPQFKALLAMYGFQCVAEKDGPYPVGIFKRV
ncbi:MAG TPA: methyltransferase domain-containing protein [Thermoguttaceae bacterium]|nr:methyltransferase domain-containing protein [Thermoguttaceae bacterium]